LKKKNNVIPGRYFSAIIFYQMLFCYIFPMIHVYKVVVEIYSGGTEFTILAG